MKDRISLLPGKNDKVSFIIIETTLFDIYIQLFDKKDRQVFHVYPRPLVKTWGYAF